MIDGVGETTGTGGDEGKQCHINLRGIYILSTNTQRTQHSITSIQMVLTFADVLNRFKHLFKRTYFKSRLHDVEPPKVTFTSTYKSINNHHPHVSHICTSIYILTKAPRLLCIPADLIPQIRRRARHASNKKKTFILHQLSRRRGAKPSHSHSTRKHHFARRDAPTNKKKQIESILQIYSCSYNITRHTQICAVDCGIFVHRDLNKEPRR